MNFPFHKSLRCAIRGIVRCLKNERNMRFHTMAALYVLFFSGFFRLSRAELAVLFVTIGAVLSAEVFNTAAEDLCDYVSPGFARRIGSVKDLAAGAVLLSALAAVGVGIVLFWRPERFAVISSWFLDAPWRLALLLVSFPAAAAFVVLPGRGDKPEKPGLDGKSSENSGTEK